jgi:hypothetical protein
VFPLPDLQEGGQVNRGFAGGLAGAARHFGDVRRIGDHRDYQFIALRSFRRAVAPVVPASSSGCIDAARPDGDLMAALQQIEHHRASRDPEADESDIHAALCEVEAAVPAKAAGVEYSFGQGRIHAIIQRGVRRFVPVAKLKHHGR